jgi:hypothetical protein
VEAITKHIGYDVRTVKELKNEIEKILSNKKMLITADWKNRLPKDNELAKNYVVLFNIEKISNKNIKCRHHCLYLCCRPSIYYQNGTR